MKTPLLNDVVVDHQLSPDPAETIHYLVYGSAGEPLQILNQSGIGEGLVTDVVHEIFRNAPYELTTIIRPLKRIKREMQYGEVKRWIAYALRSWEQEGVWDHATFAEVDLIHYPLSLVYADDRGEQELDLHSLNGQEVIWLRGFKYPGALNFQDQFGLTYLRTSDHVSAVKMLKAGRAVYFMENAARIRFAMQRLGVAAEQYRFFPLKQVVPPTQITLLMSNDLSEKTRAFVNDRLAQLQHSGWLSERAKHYGF
ncbi:hypothetical protein G8770_08510 [Aestuariicella hydrocarbonica]|uniref:Uncharacterized protein n=1 Tax=Pseudomaricurvus hydrocarbonicus TaxID=1470433 RepID=A0A9E5JS71_9GAMM|nr:hypothetical protein [Aestuariicella hydrocarbonica]NHO65579.1 hypothetical protein [Aestuariicella hydrocarbonica]